jgi:homoaconitate hydratase family protein
MHALHKIIAAHATGEPADVRPGAIVEAVPDVFAIGVERNGDEIEAIEADLMDLGVSDLPLTDRIVAFFDHAAPAPFPAAAVGQKKWIQFFRKHGIPVADPGAGVSHLILPEQGWVTPGVLVALNDSHTPTMGAVGAYAACLAGGTLSLLALGRYWVDVPDVALYRLVGQLQPGVLGRDVSMSVNGAVGQRGALGVAVEFGGSYVSSLSMDMRFTLCNMGTEIGATASYIQPDATTIEWVRPRARSAFQVFETDTNFAYADVREFDITGLEPQVAKPHAPDNTVPVTAVEGTAIDQAFIGSCASGRVEDLAEAARILRGRKVHPDVRLIVTPGSREVLIEATRRGDIEVLHEANAIVTNANCGSCAALHEGVLAPGDVAISCNTRNFAGRMGPGASIYLGSPATVAASAIEGRIADPRRWAQV